MIIDTGYWFAGQFADSDWPNSTIEEMGKSYTDNGDIARSDIRPAAGMNGSTAVNCSAVQHNGGDLKREDGSTGRLTDAIDGDGGLQVDPHAKGLEAPHPG